MASDEVDVDRLLEDMEELMGDMGDDDSPARPPPRAAVKPATAHDDKRAHNGCNDHAAPLAAPDTQRRGGSAGSRSSHTSGEEEDLDSYLAQLDELVGDDDGRGGGGGGGHLKAVEEGKERTSLRVQTPEKTTHRCYPVCVGGAGHLEERKTCPHLRCTACDHRVVRVRGHVWDGQVDYLFFRNNVPNVDRLRAHLLSQTNLRWVCGGFE